MLCCVRALHACHVWLLLLHPTPVIVPGKNVPKAPVRPLSEAEEGKVLQAVQAAVKTHTTHTPLLVRTHIGVQRGKGSKWHVSRDDHLYIKS
jgi:hypothetical protein